jgi:hypothetical protein
MSLIYPYLTHFSICIILHKTRIIPIIWTHSTRDPPKGVLEGTLHWVIWTHSMRDPPKGVLEGTLHWVFNNSFYDSILNILLISQLYSFYWKYRELSYKTCILKYSIDYHARWQSVLYRNGCSKAPNHEIHLDTKRIHSPKPNQQNPITKT